FPVELDRRDVDREQTFEDVRAKNLTSLAVLNNLRAGLVFLRCGSSKATTVANVGVDLTGPSFQTLANSEVFVVDDGNLPVLIGATGGSNLDLTTKVRHRNRANVGRRQLCCLHHERNLEN